MSITKKSSMQIKRGYKTNLPLLKDGQLGYCKDANELWIGNDGKNTLINSKDSDNVTAEFIKLISPNGTAFKLSVDDNGQLIIAKDGDGGGDIEPPVQDYTGLILNQIYGGGSGAACSHHFVELYNKSDKDIVLDGLSLYGATYKRPDWQHVPLTGTIPAKCSFLVRGVASTDSIVPISKYDMTCSLKLDKGMKVFLIKSTDPNYLDGIVNPWNIDDKFTMVDGYIDGFGCHGNSGLMGDSTVDMIDGFETEAPGGGDPGTTVVGCGGNSKQTSMRRKAFADTDVNSEDFEALRYANFITDETLYDKQPRWSSYGPWDVDDKFDPNRGEVIDPPSPEDANCIVTNNNEPIVTSDGDYLIWD